MSAAQHCTPSIQINDAVALEPLKPSHAEALFQLIELDRVILSHYLYWVDRIQSAEETRQHYIQKRLNRTTYGSHWFMITVQDQAAGVIGVKSIDAKAQRAELGYWLYSKYSGRGVMTQSIEKVIEWLQQDLGVKEIEIQCYRENTASSQLALRVGAHQHQVIKSYASINQAHKDLLVYRRVLVN
jgi:ribosomal-protein-serine acetyltransferase